jgi:hypothetical protein
VKPHENTVIEVQQTPPILQLDLPDIGKMSVIENTVDMDPRNAGHGFGFTDRELRVVEASKVWRSHSISFRSFG